TVAREPFPRSEPATASSRPCACRWPLRPIEKRVYVVQASSTGTAQQLSDARDPGSGHVAITSTSESAGTTEPLGAPAKEPTEPIRPRAPKPKAAPRRTRVVVRRVDPWSILKFSLLFYFCLMLVVMFALMILYWILGLT